MSRRPRNGSMRKRLNTVGGSQSSPLFVSLDLARRMSCRKADTGTGCRPVHATPVAVGHVDNVPGLG
jgi:hypothetical protein